jgi:signal transduction histidine kinase
MMVHAKDVEAVQRIDIVPKILDTVCELTGMRFAAVARVTNTHWIACSVRDSIEFGLAPGGELRLDTTICDEIRESGEAVIISDVPVDDRYHNHRTPAMYGFRSYISMPIVLPDGVMFGTLCAIDPEPRDLSAPAIRESFALFANLIGMHLDLGDRLEREIQAGARREQFIAVLGHDLRNPLASIKAGVSMLEKGNKPERSGAILVQMHKSADRMAAMIGNILDFARGRLGGGMSLNITEVDIPAMLHLVIDELAAVHPERDIVLRADPVVGTVRCDGPRIAQVVSNLLGNAISHGATDRPIRVDCAVVDATLTVSVTNHGEPIAPSAHEEMFLPFASRNLNAGQDGLGLGLYIASQIAAAHDGAITIASSPEETRFTMAIPLG